MRAALFLIVVGLGGAAILIALGIWQLQRLAWKQDLIAEIELRIAMPPVPLPAEPDPARDAYLPVTVAGVPGSEYLLVLVSQKDAGPGFRVITTLSQQDGPILLDLGFISAHADAPVLPRARALRIIVGNLQWPQETDSFTPEPDAFTNIWFAREVDAMAEALGARPILVVVREPFRDDDSITPLPVDTSQIPNNHLQYAITWFSLAVVWAVMSIYFYRRRKAAVSRPARPTSEG